MHRRVVMTAQQTKVAQRSCPAVRPMHAVMRIAPRRRPVAPGKSAATVTHHQCPPYRDRDCTGSATDTERLPECVEQNCYKIRVTSDASGRGAGKYLAAHKPTGRAGPVLLEGVETDHQQHVGSLSPDVGQVRSRDLAQAGEPVGVTAAGRTEVRNALSRRFRSS